MALTPNLGKTYETRMSNHTCYAQEGVCRKDNTVHKYLTEQCPLTTLKLDDNNPKIAFLSGAIKNTYIHECKLCQQGKCKEHLKRKNDPYIVPNIVIIAREKEERGKFEWKEFGAFRKEGTRLPKETEMMYAASEQEISSKTKKTCYNSTASMICPEAFNDMAQRFPENALVDFLAYALSRKSFLNTNFITTAKMMECLFPIYDYIQRDSKIFDIKKLNYFEIGSLKFINLYAFCAVRAPIPIFFFPDLLNHDHRKAIKKVPDFVHFLNLSDSGPVIQAKKIFYNQIKSKRDWDFFQEQRNHLKAEILALMKKSLKVQDEWHQFQLSLREATGFSHPITSVFSYPTLIHCDFVIYMNYCLDGNNIYEIKYPNTGPPIGNCSPNQMFYEFYLKYTIGDKVITGMTNPNGCHKLKDNITLDGYEERGTEKIAHEFEGCAPFKECHKYAKCKNPNPSMLAPKRRRTPKEREKFLLKKYKIKTSYKPECEFLEDMKKEENQDFVKYFKENHQLYEGLKPKRSIQRESVIGGITDTYIFDWNKEDFPLEELHNVDYNSMYCDVALRETFPTGKYELLFHENKVDSVIKWNGNEYVFIVNPSKQVQGTMMVDILPPRDLLYPYLSIKSKLGRQIRALCAFCAINNQTGPCSHDDDKRTFRQCTYTFTDLNYSRQLGYQ